MATIQARKVKKQVSYTATVRIRGNPPVTATFRRKTDAQLWASRTETEIRDRRHVDSRHVTLSLSEALGRYLADVTIKKAVKTQAREKVVIRQLKSSLGTVRLTDVSPALLARYRDERGKQVGPYSVRLELSLLSHLYRIARQEWQLPVSNPLADVKRPAAPRGRTRFLTQREAKLLLSECRKSRNKKLYPYVLLLLHSGMRPDECATLTWAQVNFTKRYILLTETKNRDVRRVPMTMTVRRELKKIFNAENAENFIFVRDAGSRLSANQYFRRAFEKACGRAQLTDLHLHDLRHTAASHLLAAGVDLRTLAELLGHRTMAMVMRYTHILDGERMRAIQKLEKLGT